MVKTVKYFVAVIGLAAIAACSVFGDRVASKVADGIDKYCEEPANARAVYRDTINAQLAGEGHSIEVTCNGDL